jgi:hypothetical protein
MGSSECNHSFHHCFCFWFLFLVFVFGSCFWFLFLVLVFGSCFWFLFFLPSSSFSLQVGSAISAANDEMGLKQFTLRDFVQMHHLQRYMNSQRLLFKRESFLNGLQRSAGTKCLLRSVLSGNKTLLQ